MRKLLLVEDSPTQAARMRLNFESAGLNVLVANNGEDALERVEQFCPDLILLDLQLPGINGIEVCRKLKANLHLRIIPVVIVSAEDALKFMVESYDAGADYYVVKDENGDKVLELLVESILIRRSRSRLTIPSRLRASVA